MISEFETSRGQYPNLDKTLDVGHTRQEPAPPIVDCGYNPLTRAEAAAAELAECQAREEAQRAREAAAKTAPART